MSKQDECAGQAPPENEAEHEARLMRFYSRIFPKGPSREKMVSAIDLCDRTIRKNQAGMAERTT